MATVTELLHKFARARSKAPKGPLTADIHAWMDAEGVPAGMVAERLGKFFEILPAQALQVPQFIGEDVANMAEVLGAYGGTAHLYLPGVGTVKGIGAGNYSDSTGTTAAVPDALVGLVLDGAGVVEREAYPQPNFASSSGLSVGAGWVISDGAASLNGGAGILTDATNYAAYTSGEVYQITINVVAHSAGGAFQCYLRGDLVSNSFGMTEGSYTFTAKAGTSTAEGLSVIGLFSCVGTISSISVKQVTGTHAAQSVLGKQPTLRRNAQGTYYWEFSGTHSLAMSTPYVQLSDDAVTIAAFSVAPLASDMYVVNTSCDAGLQMVGSLTVKASEGAVAANWVDSLGASVTISSPGSYSGKVVVATASKVGNSKKLRVNGAQQGAVNSTALGTTSATAGVIGGYNVANASLGFTGELYGVVSIKGSVSDAELIIIERGLNALSGYAAGSF